MEWRAPIDNGALYVACTEKVESDDFFARCIEWYELAMTTVVHHPDYGFIHPRNKYQSRALNARHSNARTATVYYVRFLCDNPEIK